LHEYEWLRDVHDELAQCGVRLTTFLFGQERLCEQRARFQESGDTHIVKRFMVETLRFRGIRSAIDAATCLRSYDEHAYPMEVRRIMYTTNAIESLNMQVRKVIKNRGHFPNDEAATKLIWLALRNIAKNWKMPAITWRAAKSQFATLFAERFTAHL